MVTVISVSGATGLAGERSTSIGGAVGSGSATVKLALAEASSVLSAEEMLTSRVYSPAGQSAKMVPLRVSGSSSTTAISWPEPRPFPSQSSAASFSESSTSARKV